MSNQLAHLCNDCGKGFKKLCDLNKHFKIVHIKSATEICPICGEGFVLKYKLKNHMVSKHEFKKDFQCDKCLDTFLSNKGLDAHMRTCNERKHACTKCFKSFKKTSHLKSHMDSHLENKSYGCDKCVKRFLYSTSLNQHKQEIHEKPLSHACEICSKKFSKKNGLNVHMKCHTGELPFTCTFCDQKWRQKRAIVLHMKKVHNEVYKEPQKEQTHNVVDSSESFISISEYFNSSYTYSSSVEEGLVKDKDFEEVSNEVISAAQQTSEWPSLHHVTPGKDIEVNIDPESTWNDKSCPHCAYSCKQYSTYKHHVYFKHGEGQHRVFYKNSENLYDCEECEFLSPKVWLLKQHISANHVDIDSGLLDQQDEKIERNSKEDESKTIHAIDDITDESTTIEPDEFNWISLDDTKEVTGDINLIKDFTKRDNISQEAFILDTVMKREDIKLEEYEETEFVQDLGDSKLLGPMFQISEDGKYFCEFTDCEYKTKTKSSIKKHIQGKHCDARSDPCDKCSYIAKNPQALRWHVEGVHGSISMNLCTECGFESKWRTSLNSHIKEVHRGIKRLTGGVMQICPDCDYQCGQRESMLKHIRGKHSSEIHQCNLCEFESKWIHVFKRHVKNVHTLSIV